jgi:hypothetical protein
MIGPLEAYAEALRPVRPYAARMTAAWRDRPPVSISGSGTL